MSALGRSRGLAAALAILTALDLLTAFWGYLFASMMFSYAQPLSTWSALAWLYGAAVMALPISAIVCPVLAWLNKGWRATTRLLVVSVPLLYSIPWSIGLLPA